jgi:hypothetical protein
MTKSQIIREIQRTAQDNGGRPLGRAKFFGQTGIKESDWRGRYWARWNDALQEAGFGPKMILLALKPTGTSDSMKNVARESGSTCRPTKSRHSSDGNELYEPFDRALG